MFRSVTLHPSLNPGHTKDRFSFFAGDTVEIKLAGLPQSYNGKVATFVAKKGKPTQIITGLNVLPAFASTGNLTQVLAVDAKGVATVQLVSSQTGAFEKKTYYTLEIEIDVDPGKDYVMTQVEVYVEQSIGDGDIPGLPYTLGDTDDLPEGLTNLYYTDTRARATLSASSPLVYNSTTGQFTIQQANGSQDGFLSAADWAIFNSKQAALGFTPENSANKGQPNGYASLDSSGLVPANQLPSYVDDVLEFANLGSFPTTGITGKIYVALDSNKTYRWTGSTYIEISPSPGSTDGVAEGSTNLYFTQARVLATILSGLSLATSTAVAATDTVLQALGKLQAQVTSLFSTKEDLSNKSTTTTLGTSNVLYPTQNAVKTYADYMNSGKYSKNDFLFGFGDLTTRSNVGAGTVITLTTTSMPANYRGGVAITTGSTATATNGIRGELTDWIAKFGGAQLSWLVSAAVLSNATDTYTWRVGWIDSLTTDSNHGLYFRYTHGVNGGRWECVTRRLGVETVVDSGVAVAAATDYILRINVNADGSQAQFFINEALVATITTNLPQFRGNGSGPGMMVQKSTGTNSRLFFADYYEEIILP